MILNNKVPPKIIAIVPASGMGTRMKSSIPKQYIKIKGYTILEYTLKTLLLHPAITHIIVSLNKSDNYFYKLSISSHLRITSVIGGKKRINSVLSGLSVKTNANWVIIHDAVRPCLKYQDLSKLIDVVHTKLIGAVLARPVSDTIKYSDKNKTVLCTINRTNLWHALTPQLFQIHILKNCLYKIIKKKIDITDEASALEYYGYYPVLILGSASNIKITYPEDIALAEFYLKRFHVI
ncbi:2-C-methyl-D-erythritol 4-phosphate cytidylyltransferase [Buchnera aphidicola (Hyadaphis tataricae)]|uniref:2-C-methyl-D-erythritol 4-phosphate cytidylyltransferase n=1 Tax=Buchnera aphidicola (Hyadaphis tataricae) TaxID=1241859 RepID=A0A4D6XZS5_9GAMM|nr:2-C-methyl-D-erythritol 4-phosphate cytidylyltransferase [Buchnera aphidicola]QCI21709.1 2-C-methyl-D-erythritol 4-phosphate cytidylyltransferase [Buchnera aphidicola (Hyadaphis tataricae)]